MKKILKNFLVLAFIATFFLAFMIKDVSEVQAAQVSKQVATSKRNKWTYDSKTSSYYYYNSKGKKTVGKTKLTGRVATYNFDSKGRLASVNYPLKEVINQRKLNPYCCGGASALMAFKTLGYYKNTSLKSFWTGYISSNKPAYGYFGGGMINPYYVGWVNSKAKKTPLKVSRMSGITAARVKDQLTKGNLVLMNVTKGGGTHWVLVYGWYKSGTTTKFKIADPWGKTSKSKSGEVYVKTSSQIDSWLKLAAKWNSTGVGYKYFKEGVAIGSFL